MRILDVHDNELTPQEVDGLRGYLEVEKILVTRHDAVPGYPEKSHVEVRTLNFTDGSKYFMPEGNLPKDWRINDSLEYFDEIPQSPVEGKEVCGFDLVTVIDEPEIPTQDAWDEYEYIQRYILFTDEELEVNRLREIQEREQEQFLTLGPQELENIKQQIAQLSEQIDGIMDLLKERR